MRVSVISHSRRRQSRRVAAAHHKMSPAQSLTGTVDRMCHLRTRPREAMSRAVFSFARPSDSGRRAPINDCYETRCATTGVGRTLSYRSAFAVIQEASHVFLVDKMPIQSHRGRFNPVWNGLLPQLSVTHGPFSVTPRNVQRGRYWPRFSLSASAWTAAAQSTARPGSARARRSPATTAARRASTCRRTRRAPGSSSPTTR